MANVKTRLLSGLHCTARPADTPPPPPHYLGGDTTYPALEHPSLKQFDTNNFVSIFYFDIYFKPYI